MACKPWIALLLVAVLAGGCAEDDPPTIELTSLAGRPVMLAVPIEASAAQLAYRWELVGEPDRSVVTIPSTDPVTAFTPDVRGVYGIERYASYRLTEELTHRFVVTVTGVPPQPAFAAPATAAVGARVALDGSHSASAEQLPLQLTWRLASRPAASAAALESLTLPMTSFTPDVAGDYVVELTAFDGELYSFNPATFTIHAAAP